MKVAIIYKSLTGNTKLVAEVIQQALEQQHEVVYMGEPMDGIEADFFFVGSWIDKGSCTKEITEFLSGLEGRRIAFFATAGFGGSMEYYKALYERAIANVNETNTIVGHFICQGKMPMSVRDRYVAMLQANPEDKNMEVNIRNFDEALSHPDEKDLADAADWAHKMAQ